jgi:hypothetical protein
MYGIAHCLIDRDGRVVSCHLPEGNGALITKESTAFDYSRVGNRRFLNLPDRSHHSRCRP